MYFSPVYFGFCEWLSVFPTWWEDFEAHRGSVGMPPGEKVLYILKVKCINLVHFGRTMKRLYP